MKAIMYGMNDDPATSVIFKIAPINTAIMAEVSMRVMIWPAIH
jgi:hypothetical protein